MRAFHPLTPRVAVIGSPGRLLPCVQMTGTRHDLEFASSLHTVANPSEPLYLPLQMVGGAMSGENRYLV
jgi:hypothetical protein